MRVLDGDQKALELWSRTRSWVVSGQRKTLARLGIAFDKVIYESDFLPEVAEYMNQGLAEGTLTKRWGDDMVMYETEREELEEMPLVRSDGLPTQHMRALAYWAAADELDDVISMQVCGNEWVAHVTCRRKLIDEMGLQNGNGNGSARGGGPPTHDIFHGMVARENESISSSKKGALLIDDLVEWIEERARRRTRSWRRRWRATRTPRRCRPRSRSATSSCSRRPSRSEFGKEKLLVEGKGSLGWDLARAPGPPRRRAEIAGRASGRGPGLPLRRGPVGALPGAPAQRRRGLRRRAALQVPLPLRALVPRRRARTGGRGGRPAGARAGPAGPGTGGSLTMRTLLVDNHDSYTYNVFHLLAAASGEEPMVVNNDAVSWRVLTRMDFDAIVLSPGPGAPAPLARLRRLQRHPPPQRGPGLRDLPRPPGDRQPARGHGQAARRWRCTAASAGSCTKARASSRTCRRASRSSATTRWRSPARPAPKAASSPGPTTAS